MNLLRSSELTEIGHHQFSKLGRGLRVLETLRPRVIRLLMRHLNIFANTLSYVVRETRGVQLKGEGEWSGLEHFSWLEIVNLSHTLDFSNLNIVTLVEGVPLVLMHGNYGLLSLLNVREHELTCVFTIGICNDVLLSEVGEGKACSSKGGSTNEA